MIHSIFIVNAIGDVIIEKHYRKPLGRVVLDVFYETKQKSEDTGAVVPPVISGARQYLVNVEHNGLYFIAAVAHDVSPLMVLEVLHRVVATFEGYFGKCNEKNLSKETVIVYEVLEEMIDSGFPLITELNILKEMIKPPSWAAAIEGVMGKQRVKDTLPTGQLSATQWRRSGVKYAQNEFFLDIHEEIDAIIDRQGHVVLSEVQGRMECRSRLSGMPELVLSFQNPRVMDDVSLHPCVRLARWQTESVMSFVPPDGSFELASYVVVGGNPIQLPIVVRPTIQYMEGGHGKFELLVSQKSMMQQVVEDVQLTLEFPRAVNSVNLTPSFGTYTFDTVAKRLVWDIRRLPTGDASSLRGTVSLSADEFAPDGTPTVVVTFKVPHWAVSGLKVNKLELFNEKYKPFKGVKYITLAGRYQIRTC